MYDIENTNPNALIELHDGRYYGDYRDVYYKIYAAHNARGGLLIMHADPEREGVKP